MKRLVLPLGLFLFAGIGVVRVAEVDERLSGLEATQDPVVGRLYADLGVLAEQVGALRERLDASREADLAADLSALEASIAAARGELSTTDGRLDHLERFAAAWREQERAALEGRVSELSGQLEERGSEVHALREANAQLARENRTRFEHLQSAIEASRASVQDERDPSAMWTELMGPSVQVSGRSTVGSGVLLASRPRAEGGWRTYVLTAWHVVRDMYGSEESDAGPVPVHVYLPEGGYRPEEATLVAHDARIDVALLVLATSEAQPHGVELASRDHLRGVQVFDRVYAVGCPLGNDPIPTTGEIASTEHVIEGVEYWMLSAPTYIGNSGGGIFDAETRELIGLFSKIYTHGSLRSTIIPHMGLATPIEKVYDWLEHEGYGHLLLTADAPEPAGASETPLTTGATVATEATAPQAD